MSDKVKNEALDFMRKNPTSMLSTIDSDKPVARAMWAAQVDDNFTVWYATGASSGKIKQIGTNPNVCVTFSAGTSYIRISGKAENVRDKSVKHSFWKDDWKLYFTKGKDDPEYALLKIVPEKIEFYDMNTTGVTPTNIL